MATLRKEKARGIRTTSDRIVIVCIVAFFCAFVAYAYRDSLGRMAENSAFALNPSAESAFILGEKYFNATRAQDYDVERASFFFEKAAALDPVHPYVQHERARIAFLKGDFMKALAYISLEISEHGETNPNAYYVRALVLGYEGRYLEAAADYETYFTRAPANWAGINDYAWVLLKADIPEGALAALEWGLREWPENPWLLHNKVIALYELERYAEAQLASREAIRAVARVTSADWLVAYPGNDPLTADDGLQSFREAVATNKMLVARAQIEEKMRE